MNLNKLLKQPVISAVVAGIILSIITWFVGLAPAIWELLKNTATSLYIFINQEISLPLWLLIFIFVPFIKWAYKVLTTYLRKNDSINSNVASQLSFKKKDFIHLAEDEYRIMRLFIDADGESLNSRQIKYKTSMSILKVEQIIEVLEEKNLLEFHSNFHR